MTDEPKKVKEMMSAALNMDVTDERKSAIRKERYQNQLERQVKFESGELVVNLTELRKLTYRTGNPRRSHVIVFDEKVWNKIKEIVPVGPGQYGTAFIEMATTLLIALVTNDNNMIKKSIDMLSKTTHINTVIDRLDHIGNELRSKNL